MEDFKWIIYVLAALYFIFRSRKKKSSGQDQEYKPFESGNSTKQPAKPVTFEDLLKEIQRSKPKTEVKPAPVQTYQQPKYVDYDDNLKNEEEDLEDVNYKNDDEIYKTYENAKKDAFNRPSYEDSEVDLKDSVIRFKHFKEYDKQNAPSEAQNIAADLQNPDNIKRAVVLAEILNRRY